MYIKIILLFYLCKHRITYIILIFQDALYPGLLYFLSAGLVTVSCVCAYFTTETNKRNMHDTITSEKTKYDKVQLNDIENKKIWDTQTQIGN